MESDSSGKPIEAWLVVAGIGACAALLLIFIIVSYTAALGKSATYDEPLHVISGYVHSVTGDYRLDPEDPALFGYWASIPHSRSELPLDLEGSRWQKVTQDSRNNQWPYVVATLFGTPGVNGDSFLQHSRFMFVLIGVMLGALIAWWSWQLAGIWAAVFATAMFVFDPNFLAHSPLVKNDVMLALTMAAMSMALWRFGKRGTWLSLAGICFATAAAVNVKYSGVLCGPIIFLCLTIRALLPEPWTVIGKTLTLRWQRLIVVPAACLAVAIVSWIAIWASYGFRYGPTHDPKLLFDTSEVTLRIKEGLAVKRAASGVPMPANLADVPLNATSQAILWIHSHRLLPQTWIYGFLFTYASTLLRGSFLMGQNSSSGWWYYFPCTMLFKTPTATLLAIPIGIIATAAMLLKHKPEGYSVRVHTWTAVCFAVSMGIYLSSAIASNLNLGLRHVLPVYPFVFVLLGAGVATLIRHLPKFGTIIAGILVLGLIIETGLAYPNYIPFFNAPSEAIAGGFNLLGDSNLDWGQDLKLLQKWQQEHPPLKLYLNYFGTADPKTYGVNATLMPGQRLALEYMAGDQTIPPNQYMAGRLPADGDHCYIAVSATQLQGIYENDPLMRSLYLHLKPAAILGKSIYVYELPPTPENIKKP